MVGIPIKSVILNTVAFATSTFGLLRLFKVKLPLKLAAAGHTQFLTNLSLIFTIVNCGVCLFSKITGKARFFSRQFLFPIALVLEVIVAGVYWPLRIFAHHMINHNAKDVMLSGIEDAVPVTIPLYLDLLIHFFPVAYLALDYTMYDAFEMDNKAGFFTCLGLGMAYKVYLSRIIDKSAGAAYPYPFLDVDEPTNSIIFGAVTTIAFFVFLGLKYSRTDKKKKME